METQEPVVLTLVDGIGWKKRHCAAFLGDRRVAMVETDDRRSTLDELRKRFPADKVCEVKCSFRHREFVSVHDFPESLAKYW